MKYFLGVDPDLSSTACAVVDETGNEVGKWMTLSRSRDSLLQMKNLTVVDCLSHVQEYDGVAVEAQQHIPRKAGQKFEIDPNDLIHIAQVAGAAIGMAKKYLKYPLGIILFPLPVQWKGSVPKHIHQNRILRKAGYAAEQIGIAGSGDRKHCYIKDSEFGKGDWKHLADAIGLAQWAAEQVQR